MNTYRLSTGELVTTKLSGKEMMKRMNRLDTLRVITEGYEEGEGYSICTKAWKAYNKLDNFTGIIHLTKVEKDWLSYMFESEFMDDDDIKCIEYYTGYKKGA